VRVNSRGYIPERVVFFAQKERVKTRGGRTLFVRPAYPVADQTVAKDGKTLKNAKAWALGNWAYHETLAEKIKSVKGTPVNNVPRDGYRILSAEQRGEGGRAWKVITPDGFLVDLREDVFLPILLRLGLPASGLIQAKLQWCQAGSQLRLEEVGSEQHSGYTPAAKVAAERKERAVVQKERRAARKTIGIRDLVVGGVYQFWFWGSGEQRVYLGRARHGGKLKTVWMQLRRVGTAHSGKSPTTNNGWFHRDWRLGTKENWGHVVLLASGSSARERSGGDVTMPKDWQKSITHWQATDSCRASPVSASEIEWV
jgi:hypothetical protein